MIPYANVKCEVPDCYNHLRVEIAEGLKRQGKAAVCYDHRKLTMEDVKKMFGYSTSNTEATEGKQ